MIVFFAVVVVVTLGFCAWGGAGALRPDAGRIGQGPPFFCPQRESQWRSYSYQIPEVHTRLPLGVHPCSVRSGGVH